MVDRRGYGVFGAGPVPNFACLRRISASTANRRSRFTSARDLRNCPFKAARDVGKGDRGLTTAEREELSRLRRENRRRKQEREILSKAAAWFATESDPSKRSWRS